MFLFLMQHSLYISIACFSSAFVLIIYEFHRHYILNREYKKLYKEYDRNPFATLEKILHEIDIEEKETEKTIKSMHEQKAAACGDCACFHTNCWGAPDGQRCRNYKKIV